MTQEIPETETKDDNLPVYYFDPKDPSSYRLLKASDSQQLKDYWERVYVISLARRPNRLAAFWENFDEDEWPFIRPEVFVARDGDKIGHPEWWNAGNGAWGCFRSHMTIIEDCLSNDVKSVLIMEDDCKFAAGYLEELKKFHHELPLDAQWIYYGGQHLKDPDPVEGRTHVMRGGNINRTHIYGLRGAEAMKAILLFMQSKETVVDTAPSMHVDHRYGVMHERKLLNVYCPSRWIAGQAENNSDISGKFHQERHWIHDRGYADFVEFYLLGGFRCGSAALCAGLKSLRCSVGIDMTKADSYNPRGVYEDKKVADGIHKNKIFSFAHFSKKWFNGMRSAAPEDTLAAGIHHPRLIKYYDPDIMERCVFVHRTPEDALAEVLEQGWFYDQNPQEVFWDNYMNHLEHQDSMLKVEFDDLVRDPARVMKSVLNYLEVEQPGEKDMERAVKEVQMYIEESNYRSHGHEEE